LGKFAKVEIKVKVLHRVRIIRRKLQKVATSLKLKGVFTYALRVQIKKAFFSANISTFA
jgi:hypothetical protein